MAISSSTFISDTILFIRNYINTNVTDPNSPRSGNNKFCLTSYPERPVEYPIVTVTQQNMSADGRLGMQTETHIYTLKVEVRVWAKNTRQRDNITQEIINDLRDAQLTNSTGTIANNLVNFEIDSVVEVSEGGKGGIHSKVITLNYRFVAT